MLTLRARLSGSRGSRGPRALGQGCTSEVFATQVRNARFVWPLLDIRRGLQTGVEWVHGGWQQ
eukprot:594311-Pyramimonas_sp.AAC.1